MSSGKNIMRIRYFCIALIAILVFNLTNILINGSVQIIRANEPGANNPDKKIIWHKRYKHIDPKTGLRTSYYQGALPESVPGGTRIKLTKAKSLYDSKSAIFLDVMAHTGTGPDPIDGHWRLAAPRKNIPGSIWLADVGTGTLTKTMTKYYQSNLVRLTGGNKAKPIIIYCTADCWMAWNAVRRASRWGYSNIFWFREGSNDWDDAGYPLVDAKPVPVEIED